MLGARPNSPPLLVSGSDVSYHFAARAFTERRKPKDTSNSMISSVALH